MRSSILFVYFYTEFKCSINVLICLQILSSILAGWGKMHATSDRCIYQTKNDRVLEFISRASRSGRQMALAIWADAIHIQKCAKTKVNEGPKDTWSCRCTKSQLPNLPNKKPFPIEQFTNKQNYWIYLPQRKNSKISWMNFWIFIIINTEVVLRSIFNSHIHRNSRIKSG